MTRILAVLVLVACTPAPTPDGCALDAGVNPTQCPPFLDGGVCDTPCDPAGTVCQYVEPSCGGIIELSCHPPNADAGNTWDCGA
jgi:hypothetical protein